MKAQDLKNSILQLAVQGKLVEQRDEDGKADELYKEILNEKERLIELGELKHEKPFENNMNPHDLPDNWKWVYLGEVLKIQRGGSPRPIKSYITESNDGVNWIKIGDAEKNTQYINKTKEKIIKDGIKRSRYVKKGDFLLSNSMSFGRPYILNIDGCIHDGWLVLSQYIEAFDKDYLFYLLSSKLVYHQFASIVTGAVVKNLNIDKVKNTLVPLPPLGEQRRIVDKIEELMPYANRYGDAYEKVTDLNKKFPLEMEKSILQYAIQGKLVEQKEEEGTAEELYQQIQEEKQTLIDEGTIRKQKELPEVTEEEIPFDIPETWKWVKLGEVIDLLSGQDMPSNTYNDRELGIPYITGASNIENSQVIISRWIETPRSVAKKGHLLLTCKGTIGKTAILDIEEAHIARQIMSINPLENDAKYINVFIKSYVNELKRQAKSMIPGISRSVILEALIPLPPLEEQKRIVGRVEELQDYTKGLVKEA